MKEKVLVEPDKTAAEIRDVCHDWREIVPDNYEVPENERALSVLCYAVSEAYYFAMDKPDHLTPERKSHEAGTHWYLRRDDGAVIDLTLRTDREYVYEWYDDGAGSGFLSHPAPANRTAKVLDEIGVNYGN